MSPMDNDRTNMPVTATHPICLAFSNIRALCSSLSCCICFTSASLRLSALDIWRASCAILAARFSAGLVCSASSSAACVGSKPLFSCCLCIGCSACPSAFFSCIQKRIIHFPKYVSPCKGKNITRNGMELIAACVLKANIGNEMCVLLTASAATNKASP